MTEKAFYPAEEYYKKQNNCEFYLVKTDYKLLMIDDIVRILNNQRETIQYHRKTEKQLEKEHARLTNQLRLSYDKINKLTDENEQLQERNNRQAKQLDNLYTLIEKQDWKTLTGLIQEFQECEKQLQREWKCYE